MKILLINKYHYLRGGAERAYFDTAKILAAHGQEIAFFSMKHPQNEPSEWSRFFIDNVDYQEKGLGLWQKIKAVFKIWYNFQAAQKLEALLKEFQPDVAHLHNIYHQLSPSIVNVLKKRGIPVVMTLHDYKLISPNYNLLVRGKIWERSRPDKYYRCVLDRCVENSYLKSAVCALEAYLHKFLKVYEKIDLFISPSEFLIKKFQDFGFKKKIVYLPNPFLAPEKDSVSAPEGGKKYLLYFGRLSEEKGIADLLRAYAKIKAGAALKIVGSGPQEAELKKIAKQEKISGVEFLGYKIGSELQCLVREAAAVVVPSKWYENAPYSVIEAMASAKVVIASGIGGLAEMIQDGATGLLFGPGDLSALRARLEFALVKHGLMEKIGEKAAAEIKSKNNPEKYYRSLLEIYKKAGKM
jgi:glycosyltransferase involved in cell wall biosynthesis